jgi:hypothetical protein
MTAPAFQDPLRQLIASVGLRPTARLLGVSAGTLARYQRAVDRGDRRIPFSKTSLESYQDVARAYLRTPSAPQVLREASKDGVWALPVREPDGTLRMRRLSSPNAHDRSKMAFLRNAVLAVRRGYARSMRDYLLQRSEHYRKTLRAPDDMRRLRVLRELLRGQTSVRVLSEDGSRVIRVVIDLNATPNELAGPEWEEVERNPYEGRNGEEIVPAEKGAA